MTGIGAINRSPSLTEALVPKLERLACALKNWLESSAYIAFHQGARQELDQIAGDLQRAAACLSQEKPLLLIVLMGGTGVGKSTLLNALARAPIAESSLVRPTTREPLVYCHESVADDDLDERLRQCRVVRHSRPELRQKIIVDAPDLDSQEEANRHKLQAILPAADVVLYVGSQEKYHDRLGWELLLSQRRRRAFAFVLNKWDRCVHGQSATGRRPDEDLERDLRAHGFDEPLIFRTCAAAWADARVSSTSLPPGEEFHRLEEWLHHLLTDREIAAIKAQGVILLLRRLSELLTSVQPPAVEHLLDRIRRAWHDEWRTQAEQLTTLLLHFLDSRADGINAQLAAEMRSHLHGGLALVAALGALRNKMASFRRWHRGLTGVLKPAGAPATQDAFPALLDWLSDVATEAQLTLRLAAIPQRLVILAAEAGYPARPMAQAFEELGQDWQRTVSAAMRQQMHAIKPTWRVTAGPRSWSQSALLWIGTWAPWTLALVTLFFLIYRTFAADGSISLWSLILLPGTVFVVCSLCLYAILMRFFPAAWDSVRGDVSCRAAQALGASFEQIFEPILARTTETLQRERKLVQDLIEQCRAAVSLAEHPAQFADVAALFAGPASPAVTRTSNEEHK